MLIGWFGGKIVVDNHLDIVFLGGLFPKDMEKRIAMIPLKRLGMPNEVADMVYYLGSDVNKFITNEIIAVAGGE